MRKFVSIVLVLVLLLSTCLFSSCFVLNWIFKPYIETQERLNGAARRRNVLWTTDPDATSEGLVVYYLVLRSDSTECYLEYNGIHYDIRFRFENGAYSIYAVDYYGHTITRTEQDGYTSYFKLVGNYEADETDYMSRVTFEIKDDTMFDGELVGKKFTLVAQDIDGDSYDPYYRTNVIWINDDKTFRIEFCLYLRHFGIGTYQNDNGTIDFAFYWLEGQRFAVYDRTGKDVLCQDTLVMSGTYEYEGLNVTLHVETNDLFSQPCEQIELHYAGLNGYGPRELSGW